MKSLELLSIGLRLVGIYALLLSATTAVTVFQTIPHYKQAWAGEFPVFLVTLSMVGVFIIFILGLVLIKFPVTVAKLLLPKQLESEAAFNGNTKDIQTAIFCVIGVYILSWALPDLLNNLLFWYAESKISGLVADSQYLYLTIVTVFEIIIGLYLSLQANGLSNLLWRLRGYKEC